MIRSKMYCICLICLFHASGLVAGALGNEIGGGIDQVGIRSLLNWIDNAGRDSVFCIIGSDDFARAVGVSSDEKVVNVTVSPLGTKRAVGPADSVSRWKGAVEFMDWLDEQNECNFGPATLVVGYKRNGVVSTRCFKRSSLPEDVRRFLSLVPGSGAYGADPIAYSSVPEQILPVPKAPVIGLAAIEGGLRIFCSDGAMLVLTRNSNKWDIRHDPSWKAPSSGAELIAHRDITAVVSTDSNGYRQILMCAASAPSVIRKMSHVGNGVPITWTSREEFGRVFCVGSDGRAYKLALNQNSVAEPQKIVPTLIRQYVANRDDSRAVSLDRSGTVELWDCRQNKRLQEIARDCIYCDATFNSEGTHVAMSLVIHRSRSIDKMFSVVVIDSTGSQRRELRPYDVVSACLVTQLQWHPESATIFGMGGGAVSEFGHQRNVVHMWAAQSGNHIADFIAERGTLRDAAISVLKDRLWACGKGGQLFEWNLTEAISKVGRPTQ